MRILVVDDSRLARAMVCRQLTEWGHRTVQVESGREAIDLVKEESFDVVMVDFKAGDMDAVEMCWHLRADQGSRHLYLMVMLPGSVVSQFDEIVGAGADELLRKPLDMAWLRARLLAASRVVQMQQDLRRLATTDGLTGALNRRSFFERGGEEVMRAKRYGRALSLLMIDIDHFKAINDTHGHPAGDEAIRSLVRSIRTVVRQTDVVGRLGGEEFGLLLPETPLDGAVLVGERLRAALADNAVPSPSGTMFRFSASAGVAQLRAADAGVEVMLARADEALYRAKRGGRDRVVTEEPE